MCGPVLSIVVVKVATPPLRLADPSEVSPSRKVTVPVACGGETVAVNATACPGVEGFGVEVSVVVVVGERTVSVAPVKANELSVSCGQ